MLPPDLDRSFFDPHLGSVFQMPISAGRHVGLELIGIDSLPPNPSARRQGFVLTFRAAERTAHPQCIYALTHPALGETEIFLVPIGPDEAGMRYEAVFN